MADGYDWHPTHTGKSVFKVENRNLGWWVLLALAISAVFHLVLYVVLGEIERTIATPEHIVWQNRREQVTIDQQKLEELLSDIVVPEEAPAEPEKTSDLDMVDKSLDEFDLMEQIRNEAVRLAPLESPQIFTREAPKAPGEALDMAASQVEITASSFLAQDLAAMRDKLIDSSAVVSENQAVLELNRNDDPGPGVDTDEFFKDAAGKAFGNQADEFVKGYSTLDSLLSRTGGLPSGEEKIALPTDILFGYNEHELKEEARLSMMKLAFIVQTNPDATFVIEGHTDSFGGDDFNKELSLKRATAVRAWLVSRLRIDASNITVVGMGKARPIVSTNGTAEEQALNRRVEIVVKKP